MALAPNVTAVAPEPTGQRVSARLARRAERALFWSGLLVSLAGSCLIMLFEALPWRTAPEGPAEAGPWRHVVGPAT